MDINSILKGKGNTIFVVPPSATLLEAAALMRKQNVGALLVRSEDEPFEGIITERDIVNALAARGAEMAGLRVSEVMVKSERLIVAEPDDLCEHVMAVMVQKGIRHMPVIEAGRIAGILSIRDLVRATVMKVSPRAHFLSDYLK